MKKILFKILSILIIVFCIYSFIFTTPIFTNDELWNFQNLFKFHNGYVLYEDINAITPPIFYYLGYIVLSIFSFTIVGFRVYNLITYGAFIFTIAKIFKALKVSDKLIPVYLSIILLFLTQNIIAGANYTVLAVLFFMIGMYLYISKKSNNWLQGLLIFLCIFTKQNVGFFYTLTVLIYELIINKKFDFKYIKNQFIKFFTFLVPTSAIFLHLYLSGSLKGFFNYCIGSLFEFGNSNFVFTVPPYLLIIVFINILLYILTRVLKCKFENSIDNDFFKNTTTLFVFLLGVIPITYPILNSTHFLYVIPFALIMIFYFLDALMLKELFDGENLKYIINLIVFAIILLITIRNFTILIINKENYHYYNDTSSPYNLLYIENNLYLKNEEIKKFIIEQENLGNRVKILSYEAALPMIELKNSNGKYDMFLSGNLGYDGINKSINEIENCKNTIYLIVTNEEDMFYQEPLSVRNYIIENLNYIGTICNYSIYSTN